MNYEEKYKEVFANVKQEYNTTKDVERKQWLEKLFPELKESEDEKIRKSLIDLIYKVYTITNYITCAEHEDMLAWLEKQGKQKPNPYSGTSFEYNGHTCGMCARDGGVEILVDGKIKERVFLDNKPHDARENLTLDGDLMQADCMIAEPKFHEGEWVVSNFTKDVFLIKSFNNGYCTLEDTKGNTISPCLPPCESELHIWTIQDAKDGDVLISQYNKPFIYNGNFNSFHVGSYCGISAEDKFNIATEKCLWTTHRNVHPATKEQRDTLFAKIREAGYEWDAEKKELKKKLSYESKSTGESLFVSK